MTDAQKLLAQASRAELLDAEVLVSWLTPSNPADLALVWVRRPFQSRSSLLLIDVSRLRGACTEAAD